MQTNLTTYTHYKPSGVQWLGDIPEHWEVTFVKHLLSIPITDGPHTTPELLDEGIPFISAEAIKNGEIDFEKKRGFISLKDHLLFSKKYSPRKGDIYMVKSGATTGNVAMVKTNNDFSIWSPLAVFRAEAKKITPEYLHLFLQSYTFRKGVELSWSFGTQQNIGMGILSNLPVTYGSIAEQTAIAQFLDRKTAQIDVVIAQKQRMIELLKERRQILIHQAVTRGLNPDVPMKDSGVEWIGKIPEHWEILKVKNVFQLIIDPASKNNGQELLSVYTEIGVKPRAELEERGNKASTTDGYWIVKKGDIVVNKLLAWMGAIGISDYDGVTSPAYDILRATKPIEGYFYHNLFRTPICISELRKHSRGIMDMRLRLYFDKFGDVRIPYPPLKEQAEIVNYIETATQKIDKAIGLKEQEIEKLKEYKASLINSVVTGKVKVVENPEG